MIVMVLFVIAIVMVAVFSVQNAMPVAISFLGWHFEASLALMALIFFLAGLITGMGILAWMRMRRSAKKKEEPGRTRPEGERPPDFQ